MMKSITCTFDDLIMSAQKYDDIQDTWRVNISSSSTSLAVSFAVDEEELAAMMAFAIAQNGFRDDKISAYLKDIAEPIQPLAPELRIIP